MAMKARMPGGPRSTPTSLTVMVKGIERGLWPTPKSTFSGPDYARAMREDSGGDDLATALWPTPQAADASPKLWPTPNATDHKGAGQQSDRGHGGDDLPTAVGGSLNPDWVEWLMGFPIGWTDLER